MVLAPSPAATVPAENLTSDLNAALSCLLDSFACLHPCQIALSLNESIKPGLRSPRLSC